MIYFDHNATTPIDPLVVEAMQPFLTGFYGNPSSLHRHGRLAATAIEQARQQVSSLINVQPEQVIFTSGGTEANNLALTAVTNTQNNHILVGATEHPSVMECCKNYLSATCSVDVLEVNEDGLLTPEYLQTCITNDTGLISVMLANNETGVIQNIQPLVEIVKDSPVIFHTDAVQALGKLNVDFNTLGVNLMTLSSHKIYGPKGVGALVHDNQTTLSPMSYGGGQEMGFRVGTENVAGIVGFGKAAELAKQHIDDRTRNLSALQKELEQGIADIKGLSIVANQSKRLPNTTQIVMDNVDGEMLLMQLDKQSIAVSSGSACSSNSKEPSSVLTAMGYNDKLALSAIRVSLGQQNTQDDVHKFISVLKSILNSNK
jgi:cysteine desulfurase